MNRLRAIIKKNYEIISYLFFGVCTTAVNFAVYFSCSHFGMDTGSSTAAAWIISVLFAFFTNRKYVFGAGGDSSIIRELFLFLGGRISSGILDILIMVLFVDVLSFNEYVIKIVSNIIVIIVNYLISKLLVFRKRK